MSYILGIVSLCLSTALSARSSYELVECDYGCNFRQAKEMCESLGGNSRLAVVDDDQSARGVFNALKSSGQESAWIGLAQGQVFNRIAHSRKFGPQEWLNSDESKVGDLSDLNYWAPNQPGYGEGKCVSIVPTRWRKMMKVDRCNQGRQALCEKVSKRKKTYGQQNKKEEYSTPKPTERKYETKDTYQESAPEPTPMPTPNPTTAKPTARPTEVPTAEPSAEPGCAPTPKPTGVPTPKPTPKKSTPKKSTPTPTEMPTSEPSPEPTPGPTIKPTGVPTLKPTGVPTPKPTEMPTPKPTGLPTPKPTEMPTVKPTEMPTVKPTEMPTVKPTEMPTVKPTEMPTVKPTEMPTVKPTEMPTPKPTDMPTPMPTGNPTGSPTEEAKICTEEDNLESNGKCYVGLSDEDHTVTFQQQKHSQVGEAGNFYYYVAKCHNVPQEIFPIQFLAYHDDSKNAAGEMTTKYQYTVAEVFTNNKRYFVWMEPDGVYYSETSEEKSPLRVQHSATKFEEHVFDDQVDVSVNTNEAFQGRYYKVVFKDLVNKAEFEVTTNGFNYNRFEMDEKYRCNTCGLCGDLRTTGPAMETCSGKTFEYEFGGKYNNLKGWTYQYDYYNEDCGTQTAQLPGDGNDNGQQAMQQLPLLMPNQAQPTQFVISSTTFVVALIIINAIAVAALVYYYQLQNENKYVAHSPIKNLESDDEDVFLSDDQTEEADEIMPIQ